MNDASHQQEPSDPLSGTYPEVGFCIKQEPLEIEPDDFLDGQHDSNAARCAIENVSFTEENIKLEILAVNDEDPLAPERKRRKKTKPNAKKIDDNVLDPCSKVSFECSKKYCEFSCASAADLDLHTKLRHEEPPIRKRKPRKFKDPSQAVPVASLAESEEVSSSNPDVVDPSGFVVRIEKTFTNGKVMYSCSRCKNMFRKLETAEAHITKVHMNIKRFTCSDCGRGFDRAMEMADHTKVHTRERPYKCPAENCIYSASWSSTLYKHVRRRHKDYQGDLKLVITAKGGLGKPQAEENIPSSSEAKTDEMTEDKSENEDLLLVQIPPVEDVENDSGQLDLYEEFNIIDNRNEAVPHYKCKICLTDYTNLYSIKSHVNEAHINVRKRTCLVCGVTLSHSSNLTIHMRTHSGERPFKCEECGKGFLTSSDLKRHARRLQHGIGVLKKELKCVICKQNFESSDDLERHASVHVAGVKDLDDSFQFTPYEYAKLTVSESSEPRVYTCNMCGMQFSDLPAAKCHVNDDHKDVKHNSCLYCGSTYNTRQAMRKHMLIHKDKQTYKCLNSNCNYSTDQYANLQHHLRECTNVSNRATVRKCMLCSVEFGDLGILRTHFRTVHKLGKSYSCLHCEKSFASLSDLTQHISSHDAIHTVVCCPIENCQFIVTSEEDRRHHHQWHEKKSNPLPRPYVCDTCGKNFERSAILMRHRKRIHQL